MKQSEIKHISEYNAAPRDGDKVLRFTHAIYELEENVSIAPSDDARPEDFEHVAQVTNKVFAAWSDKHPERRKDPALFVGEWVKVRS